MSNEFNLEWAKRGGVVSTSVNEKPSFAKHLTTKRDGRVLLQLFIKNDESEQWNYGFIYPNDFHVLRMATREECEEAGVEYIEPPADVEALQKRIDELEQSIKNLHKVKGRHHTQQALESLFKLVGLENNIGLKMNENGWE
jgi:hypothetical protein